MKTWTGHITLLAAALWLVCIGGGLGWQRCSCSGRVQHLVLPADDGCCRSDSDCMTVEFASLDPACQVHADVPHMDVPECPAAMPRVEEPRVVSAVAGMVVAHRWHGPPGGLLHLLRVLRI